MVFHVGFLNFEKYEAAVQFHGLAVINISSVRFEVSLLEISIIFTDVFIELIIELIVCWINS